MMGSRWAWRTRSIGTSRATSKSPLRRLFVSICLSAFAASTGLSRLGMSKFILMSLPHKRSASRPRRPRSNTQKRRRRRGPTRVWPSASPVSRSSPRSRCHTSTASRERDSLFLGTGSVWYSEILYVRVIDTLFLVWGVRAGWARSCNGRWTEAQPKAWTQDHYTGLRVSIP